MSKKQIKCIECGYLGLLVNDHGKVVLNEVTLQARLDLRRWCTGTGKVLIRCLKGQDHVVTGVTDPLEHIDNEKVLNNVHVPRDCSYYYHYEPGHSPDNHLELAENARRQRFLVKVTLVSAVVGAVVGGLIAALVDKLSSSG